LPVRPRLFRPRLRRALSHSCLGFYAALSVAATPASGRLRLASARSRPPNRKAFMSRTHATHWIIYGSLVLAHFGEYLCRPDHDSFTLVYAALYLIFALKSRREFEVSCASPAIDGRVQRPVHRDRQRSVSRATGWRIIQHGEQSETDQSL
jgi:hypothetical protein